MKKEKFVVTGMTCASCQAHVDKAVRKVSGVKDVSVNLLTNSMEVTFEGDIENNINKAVKDAGYKSYIQGKNINDNSIDNELNVMIKRLITSLILLIPLVYISMGFMLNWPIGELKDNLILLGLIEMIISFIILVINKKFFISGFKGLIHKSPNMDTLVSLGAGVAFLYSVVILIIMTFYRKDDSMLMKYAMNLTFETSGMVPTLITIGKTLESYSKGKTTNALKALINLKPKEARVLKDGVEYIVKEDEIKVGDIIIVKTGEMIPVDGIIIDGASSIDEQTLTGESVPVDKKIGDKVYQTTINKNGVIKIKAEMVGKDTSFSKIIELVNDVNSSKAPISKIADKVAGIFVPTVISIATITFIIWLIVGLNINLSINETIYTFAINKGISVLVISCPCALGLATPVAIMVGSGKAARNGILFKNSESLESSGKVNFVVLDKTGTITIGKPNVEEVNPLIDEKEFLCLVQTLEKNSSHPLAKAIIEYTNKIELEEKEINNFEEIPGFGVKGVIDNKNIYGVNLKNALNLVKIDDNIYQKIDDCLKKGQTPMIFIYDDKLIGFITVFDKLKEDSIKAIEEFKKLGVTPVMATGDNEKVAKTIADNVGISYYVSNVTPKDKADLIYKLKQLGNVSMVGDGINDSVALSLADTGIAIGAGADVAKESADIILIKSSLMDAAKAIRLSRQILKNIKENLFWAFIYNIIMIPIAIGVFYFTNISFLKEMKPWYGALAMALSSVFVVLNALRLNLFNLDKNTNRRKTISIPDGYLEIQEKEDENMKNEVISVNGMMCKNCAHHVEEACLSVSGVKKAKASLQDKNVTIKAEEDLDIELVKKAIKDAGYEA